MKRRDLPLVYACSGCSSVAQLANDVAVHLDHQGLAEMSCISGVGGGVPALVKTAQSGRNIIAIDGCQMHCVAACLAKCDVAADQHVKLYEQGHKKRLGEKASTADLVEVIEQLEHRLEHLQRDNADFSRCANDDSDGDSRWDTQKKMRFFSRSTLRY